MINYLKFGVVIIYIWLTVFAIYSSAVLSLDIVFNFWRLLSIGLLYMAFCFSSVYWLTWKHLFMQSVRKPFNEEVIKLQECFQSVINKCADNSVYNLYVHDADEWLAYALGKNNIVLSTGMLNTFSNEELEGIMAHELGHLRSRDTLASSAMAAAFFLPGILIYLGRVLKAILFLSFHTSILLGVTAIIFVLVSLAYPSRVSFVGFLLMLMVVLILLSRLAKFFVLGLARLMEYRQDAFAASLGYAVPLMNVLKKLSGKKGGKYSVIRTVLYGTHPLTHNRIRELKKLAVH